MIIMIEGMINEYLALPCFGWTDIAFTCLTVESDYLLIMDVNLVQNQNRIG